MPEAQNSKATTVRPAKGSILVVEDAPNERAGLCRLLQRSGFEVKEAADGVEGLERVEREDFDLLLVDVRLPRMSGLEMLAHLPENRRPKVLVISGDDRAETVLEALKEHAEQCIAKPVEPQRLLEMVQRALATPSIAEKIQVLSASPHFVELRFPCDRRIAERIKEYLRQLESGLPAKVRQSVELAFHELLMNAIEWGGHLDPSTEIELTVLRTSRLLLYRIADPGTGFDPTHLEHAAAGNHSSDFIAHTLVREKMGLRPGGFGMLIAKSLVDEVIYNEVHNEVVLLKYLNDAAA